MQRYNTKTHLGSYTISTQLIKKITEFLSHTLPGMLSSDMSVLPAEESTSITLIYSDHAVKYPRLGEYRYDRFAGEIQGLQMELRHLVKFQDITEWNVPERSEGNERGEARDEAFRSSYEQGGAWRSSSDVVLKAIVVNLSFNKEKEDNYLYMALQDDRAEKELPAIENKLLSVLDQYKNNHSFIFRSQWFPPILFLAMGLFGSLTFLIHTQPFRSLFAILFGISIYLFIFPHIKGYSTFDSRRQKNWDVFFRWVTAGIAGSILAIILFF